MHSSGVRMSNRQIRDGEVIREGAVDFWDNDQQGSFEVQQDPFVIRPGDSFQTSCYYDDTDAQLRQFGYSSQDEMCTGGFHYYPKIDIGQSFACVYDASYQQCSASWTKNELENTTQLLERRFGDPTNECLMAQSMESTPASSDMMISAGYLAFRPSLILVLSVVSSFIHGV